MARDLPTVAVLGTMDTKGAEHRFLCDVIGDGGGQTVVIDSGIRGEPREIRPTVTRAEVALAAGSTIEDVRALPSRGEAVETMLEGVKIIIRRLYEQGEIDAVIALGGAEGTVIGTAAMQALPLGVPKLMVSAIASGPRTFGPFVGTSDVAILSSPVDIAGFNSVSTNIYGNAAAAILGMAQHHRRQRHARQRRRPCIGLTMLGNTQAALDKLADLLAPLDVEIIPFHANGVGGPAMERLVEDGRIDLVVELAINEVTNELMNGVTQSTTPDRLRVAGRHGVPQVFVPACADFFTLGAVDSLPPELRNRRLYRHNPHFTLVRASTDEMRRFGEECATRLNESTGPLTIIWPEQGLSIMDCPGGEFWDPEADIAFLDALSGGLTVQHEVVRVDGHVNDTRVADAIKDAIERHLAVLASDQSRPRNEGAAHVS